MDVLFNVWVVIILSRNFIISSSVSVPADEIKNFKLALDNFKENILQVSKFQNHVNTAVAFENISFQQSAIANGLIQAVTKKFQQRIEAVNNLHNAIQKMYLEKSGFGQWYNCCLTEKAATVYDSSFNLEVDMKSFCSIAAPNASDFKEVPNKEFLYDAKANLLKYPGLKWQYFGSETGVFTQFPTTRLCTSDFTKNDINNDAGFDNRFRPWYVQASTPISKDIVIVIDHSASMKKFNRMESAVQAAITVLNTLNPNDRIAVVTFSNKAHALGKSQPADSASLKQNLASDTSCFNSSMASATQSNIDHLKNMIMKIVPSGETYYKDALKIAFNFLQNAFTEDKMLAPSGRSPENVAKSRKRAILFLSDGEPSDSPFGIYKLIYEENKKLYNSVVLLCYALGKSTFGSVLKVMAAQNFNFSLENLKSCKDFCNLSSPLQGMFQHVRESKNLRNAMGSYYNFFYKHMHSESSKIEWSVPYFDVGGLGMVITAASAVVIKSKLVGVVGVDLSLHELLSDLTYLRAAGDAAYAFMIDFTGRAIMHPYLPQPIATTQNPILTNINAFERSSYVQRFLKSTLEAAFQNNGMFGQNRLFVEEFNITRIHSIVHEDVLTYSSCSKYICSVVPNLPSQLSSKFLLCVVIDKNLKSVSILGPQALPTKFDFLYHRLDLDSAPAVCRHLDQMVSTNLSSVMFSPAAFIDSGKYVVTKETREMVTEYKNYMITGEYTGSRKIFKDGIRNAVIASWILERFWKNSENASKNVLWRYFGSELGIFRIFPGVTMPKFYDPVDRPWYKMAHSLLFEYVSNYIPKSGNLSTIVGSAISAPYLDANGAGLVITISSAIFKKNKDSTSYSQNILGVMGADIHLTYLEELVRTSFSACSRAVEVQSCILIDFSGFVVYDKFLMSRNPHVEKLASSSNYHLIHFHPAVAHFLINRNILIHQKCVYMSEALYKTYYLIDLRKVEAADLPFAISYVPTTNVVLISVPSNFKGNQACIGHNLPWDDCMNSKRTMKFSNQCESSCIHHQSDSSNYMRCLNMYNYTWSNAPPPCKPLQSNAEWNIGANISDETNAQDMVLSQVPWCPGEVSAPIFQIADQKKNSKGSQIFIIYTACCCFVLLGVWIGLNRRRITSLVFNC